MNIIAVDSGASFVKCGLFVDGELKNNVRIPTPDIKRELNSVFNTYRIEETLRIIENFLLECVDVVDDATLCIDNEMHGFILAYEDGTPYTDYISWKEEYTSCDEVLNHLYKSENIDKVSRFISDSGMPLRSGLPSSTLCWMSMEGKLNTKDRLYFYTLGDYIIKRIVNHEPFCHPTNAAASGMCDIRNNRWNKEYISCLIGESDVRFPVISEETFLVQVGECLINVLPAIGDQQSALLGGGFNDLGMLSINMGTGAQVSRLLDECVLFDDCQTRPYFNGYYLKTIPHIPSGRAINVFFRFLKSIIGKRFGILDEEIWSYMHDAVTKESISESTLSVDVSFFENAITDETSGSIRDINEYEFTIDNLMGAVFSCMIDNFLKAVDKVNEGLPLYNEVLFTGGVANRWNVLIDGIIDGIDEDVELIMSDNDALYGCMKYAMLESWFGR